MTDFEEDNDKQQASTIKYILLRLRVEKLFVNKIMKIISIKYKNHINNNIIMKQILYST